VPSSREDLRGLNVEIRRLYNIVKMAGHWDTHKKAITCYNKEIKRAKSPHDGVLWGYHRYNKHGYGRTGY
jgi:hypothetical protein